MLVLEEGWWSPATLGFAQFLLEQAGELPVLIVLTVRADRLERRPRAAALLDALSGRADTGRVRLQPLGREELQELLRQGLGVGPQLAERLAKRGEGQPLELVEIVRDLDQRGVLVDTPEGWELAPGAPALPPTLDALWQGRVARLAAQREGWVEALATAAVLGGSAADPHWFALATHAGAPDPERLLHRARREGLVGAGLVTDEAGLRVAHGSVVPALVRLARRRGTLATLHARCAEQEVAPVGSRAQLRHLLGAGAAEQAREVALVTLEKRLLQGKVLHSGELLHMLEAEGGPRPGPAGLDEQGARLRLLAARLDELGGERDRARTTALRLFSAADRRGWPEVGLGAQLLLGRIALLAGEGTEAVERGRAAERQARRAGQDGGLAEAWTLLGWRALLAGEGEELEEYVALLVEVGRPEATLLALRGQAELEGTRSRALVREAGAALDEARERGAWAARVALLGLRGDLHRRGGRLEAAAADYREAALWERALGLQCWWPPLLGLGLVELEAGEPRQAGRLLDRCLVRLERQGPPGLAAVAHLGLAVIAAQRQLPAALFHARQAAELLRLGGGPSPDVVPLCGAIPVEAGSAMSALVHRMVRLQRGG